MSNCIRFYDFLKLLDEPKEHDYYLDDAWCELDTLDEMSAHNPDRFYNIVVERVHVNHENYGNNVTVYLKTTS